VREGRWIDSFVFNSSASWLFGPLVFAIAALSTFSGGDLISAEGIALVFALGIAGMYAILTSIMPRSGGDYIFNSRVVHPSFGFAFNFSLTIWQLFSAAFTLYYIANVALGPGLQVLGFFAKEQWIAVIGTQIGNPTNSFLFASVVNVVFTLVILSGIRKTFRSLNILWGITILGTLLLILSLLTTSASSFHSSFNSYVFASNGTSSVSDPFSFVLQSGPSIPYALAIPAIAICASSVIWVFWETYVAGEVRRASQIKRNLSTMAGAGILNGVLFMLLIYLIYRVVGWQFLSAVTSFNFTSGTLFSGPLQAITAVLILMSGNLYSATFLLLAITLGATVLLLPALYLQPIRSVFAWSFDRIVPERMSAVSSKFHTPLVTTLILSLVIEIMIVFITEFNSYLLTIFYAVIIGPAFSSIFPTALSAILIRFHRKDLLGQMSKRTTYILMLLGIFSAGFILFMTYVFLSNESYFFFSSNFLSSNFLVILNFVFIPIGALIYFISYISRKSRNKIDLNKIVLEIPPE
jgi:APA family basic amino acid/polyamine antiporter